MDIQKFLTITRGSNEVFLQETATDNLLYIWEIYDELIRLIDEEINRKPELVISVAGISREQTQYVFLDREYIVVELSQLHRIAREITFLHGYIETPSSTPFFIDQLSGSFSDSSVFFEKKQMLEKSPALFVLSDLEGFFSLFKPILSFIIAHELFHWFVKQPSWSEDYRKFKKRFNTPDLMKVGFDYVDHRVSLAYLLVTSAHQTEELFCDKMALNMAWRICVNKWSFHPTIFCFAISMLYSIILHVAKTEIELKEINFTDLFSRKIYAIRYITILYDKYIFTLLDYMPELRNDLSKILGANELVIEFNAHLSLKSAIENMNSATRGEILKLENINIDISQDGDELPLEGVPNEYFTAMIAYNLLWQKQIASYRNPLFNPPITLPAIKSDSKDTKSLVRVEKLVQGMLSRMELRQEFLDKFWTKVTGESNE